MQPEHPISVVCVHTKLINKSNIQNYSRYQHTVLLHVSCNSIFRYIGAICQQNVHTTQSSNLSVTWHPRSSHSYNFLTNLAHTFFHTNECDGKCEKYRSTGSIASQHTYVICRQELQNFENAIINYFTLELHFLKVF